MNNKEIIGNRLKLLRIKSGLTQTQLTKKIRCSNGLIGKVEKGEESISINLAAKLAAFFETDPEYFLDIEHAIEELKDIKLGIELKELLDDFKFFGVLTQPQDIYTNERLQKNILKIIENYLILEDLKNKE